MSEILFIGPIAQTGGPAIKNRILVDKLRNYTTLEIWNTYDRSVRARVGAISKILFSKNKYIIIAVSKKGRTLLYPFLLLKHKLSGCRYSCVVIGGQVTTSFKNKCSIKALHYADVVTVETEGLKAQMEATYKLKNIHWMPNYKEMERGIPSVDPASFESPKLRMIFLSSMRDLKGVKTLFEAFKNCRALGKNIELDYYGPIKSDFDQTLLAAFDKTEGVRYCGAVDNDNVLAVMSQYQVFVFPTEYPGEGFPAVLVEALSVGLPVIASDINYNGEIIKDGQNGYIFPHGDVNQLIEKISRCYDNRINLRVISSRNVVEARKYDSSSVINAYVETLRKAGWDI